MLPILRAFCFCLWLVCPAFAQTWYYDITLPAPTTGVGAGLGGGYWIIDPITEGREALKWAVEEAVTQLAKQREELERQQQKEMAAIEKMIGPAVAATDYPELADFQIDLKARAMREEAIKRMSERSDASRYASTISYLSFVNRQETLLLVYQQRLKALEASHKQKLTWQERLDLQSQLGLLTNQLQQEEIQEHEASSSARTADKLQQAEMLERKLERQHSKNRAGLLVSPE